MEATLEATGARHVRKERSAAHAPRGQVPAVLYGGDGEGGDADRGADPKALLKILHSESGQNTLISLKLAGAGDSARAREGLPARPDHPRGAARRLLSRRDGQAAAGHRSRSSCRASRRASSSRAACSSSSAARSNRVPAGRHPRAHRRRRHRADAAPGHPRARHRDQRRSGSRSATPT